MKSPIEAWHRGVANFDSSGLDDILAENVLFYSPVLFKPQQGKVITKAYLTAAFRIFHKAGFHYVKELVDKGQAVLEFNAEIDGVLFDGVDIISWNEEGKITEFKVMIRPFRAIEKVGEKMREQLSNMSVMDKLKIGANRLLGK